MEVTLQERKRSFGYTILRAVAKIGITFFLWNWLAPTLSLPALDIWQITGLIILAMMFQRTRLRVYSRTQMEQRADYAILAEHYAAHLESQKNETQD